jgi:hypothetical protein
VDPWIAFPTPCQESTHQEFAMRSKHIGPRLGVAFAVQITILVGIGRLGLRRQRRLPPMRRALLCGVIEPLRDSEERIVGCIGTALHAPPQKQAEEALGVSEVRCRSLLEGVVHR